MKYEKPQIVVVEDAVQTVQASVKMGEQFDTKPSNAAYRSDE
jgi:hypothetical protein